MSIQEDNEPFVAGLEGTPGLHPLVEMKKNKKFNKGIKTDALLRETTAHYIRLIGDADRKARIMIVVNSILLTICVTFLTRTIFQTPHIWISATILICANLLALFFSILSVKPELRSHKKEMMNYILHYKKCSQYSLEDYTARLMNVMQDRDKKMEVVVRDLYFFGNLLTMKYEVIKMSYRFFYWGILISVTSYLIIYLLKNYF